MQEHIQMLATYIKRRKMTFHSPREKIRLYLAQDYISTRNLEFWGNFLNIKNFDLSILNIGWPPAK